MKKITLTLSLIVLCLVGCNDRSQTSERSPVTAEDLAKALKLEFCEIIVPDAVREALQNNEARLILLRESSDGSWGSGGEIIVTLNEGENIRFFGNRFTQEVSFISSGKWGTNYRGREDLKHSWFPRGQVELENFIFGFINHSLHNEHPARWVGDTIPDWFKKEGVSPGSEMKWIKYKFVVSNAIPEEVPEAMKRNIRIIASRTGVSNTNANGN